MSTSATCSSPPSTSDSPQQQDYDALHAILGQVQGQTKRWRPLDATVGMEWRALLLPRLN